MLDIGDEGHIKGLGAWPRPASTRSFKQYSTTIPSATLSSNTSSLPNSTSTQFSEMALTKIFRKSNKTTSAPPSATATPRTSAEFVARGHNNAMEAHEKLRKATNAAWARTFIR
ncbi:hypothetical protein GQ54DRAFT_103390 [Martensiomyces pterosporus]|nr:hypothetical protein GQ54DRAFT_103390 [Martensiomyces pterosporus]